jgi:hypothetical protein
VCRRVGCAANGSQNNAGGFVLKKLMNRLSERGQRSLFWSIALLASSLIAAGFAFAGSVEGSLWDYRNTFLLSAGFAVFLLIMTLFIALAGSKTTI